MIRYYSILLLFVTTTLVARTVNAQCPNERYAPRDRERIREQIILPAATLLLEMQSEAIFVAADDKTFSLASSERAYRYLIEQTRDTFSRANTLPLKKNSKLWSAKMGSSLLGLVEGTTLIPADASIPPRTQAVETSHRVGSTLWVMLYCF